MGLINNLDQPAVEAAPGVLRRGVVGRDTGSDSLTTSYVTIAPGATTPVHWHQVEEAMFLCQGEGLAILGDETFPMKAPATLLAPPGVKHGFVNNSTAPMVVNGNFPVLDVQTKTETKTETKTVLAGGYASIGGMCWPRPPAVVSAEHDTRRGLTQ
jgi:quercetin dioxygenase-like cupin family protein